MVSQVAWSQQQVPLELELYLCPHLPCLGPLYICLCHAHMYLPCLCFLYICPYLCSFLFHCPWPQHYCPSFLVPMLHLRPNTFHCYHRCPFPALPLPAPLATISLLGVLRLRLSPAPCGLAPLSSCHFHLLAWPTFKLPAVDISLLFLWVTFDLFILWFDPLLAPLSLISAVNNHSLPPFPCFIMFNKPRCVATIIVLPFPNRA